MPLKDLHTIIAGAQIVTVDIIVVPCVNVVVNVVSASVQASGKIVKSRQRPVIKVGGQSSVTSAARVKARVVRCVKISRKRP